MSLQIGLTFQVTLFDLARLSSAAADGVGARTSATKSAIVKSIS